MSDRIYLQINGTVLPVEPKRGYSIDLDDSEQVKETEAGTFKRSVYRNGIPSISVDLWCDLEMLQMLRGFKNETSVTVRYFDPLATPDSEGDMLTTELMYVTGYGEDLKADTEDGGIWAVKFKLEDLSYV